ncbi:MAG TPA: hypothetical protein IAB90_07290 [Candidatus Coproplasma stercoripullorum]|mgnify:CR=1 FL=1|uniref:Uncharacterized protein n=1 Tax=Candidatus Coproplasma stercoripullorum TaxID=2840751 RepID=A0A9D1AH92_9FIRM|nr:hypothetical protein [Candidatus Coproplasma stercoripullorum]
MGTIERAVFDKITAVCKDGGYAIIDGDEFADALPDGERRAAGEIEGALKKLQSGGYIDMKYARGGTYCVAALRSGIYEEQGRMEELKETSPTVIEVKEKLNRFAVGMYALAALLGGAAGSAIACAIFMAV